MAQLKEKYNNNMQFLTIIASTISGYPEYVQETFARLLQDKYLDTADKILYTRYGDRELRTDEDLIISVEVLSYLLSNAKYYAKCLEYIDAEYNPVENYSSVEHETIKNEIDEVNNHGTNTKAQDTFRHGEHTDTQSFPEYTDTQSYPEYTDQNTEGDGGYNVTSHTAKIKVTSHPGDITDTSSVAPFESDTFHNKEKNQRQQGEGWDSTERIAAGDDGGNDKVTYSQKTDKMKHAAHDDEFVHGAHDDEYQYAQYDDINHVGNTVDSFTNVTDEREDNTTRDLTRSGNIGVMTAAQMMKEDKAFWQAFGWLQDMAHDIANLLTVGVWAL